MHIRLCVVLVVGMIGFISCTQEDSFFADGTGVDEIRDYQTAEQALGRGRDARTDHDNEETNGNSELPHIPGEITGAAAEALIAAHGLVPAPMADPPGALCSAPPGHRNDHPPQSSDIASTPPEPYVPSLWFEDDTPGPPAFVEELSRRPLPNSQRRSTAANAELSEIQQLLESYRADGCADDRLRQVPRCANHPYRRALEVLNNAE